MSIPTTTHAPGRLESTLRAKREAGQKCLVPYITGGLGDDWLDSLAAVIDGGADACEIGIPFSDPVMDGPIIQQANDIALESGFTFSPLRPGQLSPIDAQQHGTGL